MNPQESSSLAPFCRLITVAAVLTLSFFLFSSSQKVLGQDPNSKIEAIPAVSRKTLQSMTANGTNQEVSQDLRIFGNAERKLYNGVPAKLPLKIHVKNVTSEKWVHELEVEITNTSEKPIYFIDLYIFMSGVKFQGKPMGFWLHYGRVQLINFSEPILPEDVPLRPGEKHTFKIEEADAKSWDTFKIKEGRAEPKHLELIFQGINFGDGTGFRNTSGEPVNIHRKVSNRGGPGRADPRFDSHVETTDCFLPAPTMPVKFFIETSSSLFPALTSTLPQVNCGSSECENVKRSFYTCDRTCNPNGERPTKSSFGCNTDPACSCQNPEDFVTICFDPQSGVPITCTDVVLFACSPGSGLKARALRVQTTLIMTVMD